MKMSTMNIALTPDQAAYVRRKANKDFGNVSEFFRDMLRSRMSLETASDLKFLETTVSGAQAGPSEREIEEILSVQRSVRKELKRARRS
jgi:hypothetical protein